MPFSELDALYTHILSSLEDPNPVLQILAFHMLSTREADGDDVGHMEKVLSINPGDTEIILCDLVSVLQVVEVELPYTRHRTIHIFHASLEDFLRDKSRSGKFWMDFPSRHEEFAHLYLSYVLGFCTVYWSFPVKQRGLSDLGHHILGAWRSPALIDHIVSFSTSLLSLRGRMATVRYNIPLYTQEVMNYQLDFLNAIKESKLEEALDLHEILRFLIL